MDPLGFYPDSRQDLADFFTHLSSIDNSDMSLHDITDGQTVVLIQSHFASVCLRIAER